MRRTGLRNSAFLLCAMPLCAWAAPGELPSSADVGRVFKEQSDAPFQRRMPSIAIPETSFSSDAPENAKNVPLTISEIEVEGVTVLSQDAIAATYRDVTNQETTLDTLWVIAGKITQLYRDEGYFLSRAFVPAQEIADGKITLKVVEGYVDEVELVQDEKQKNLEPLDVEAITQHPKYKALVSRIKSHKPIKAQEVERALLQLNDIPGVNFYGQLEPDPEGRQGRVKLSLITSHRDDQFQLRAHNQSSRYLGPYQGSAVYQGSVIPFHETTASIATSLPTDELKYVSLNHQLPISADVSLAFGGNYVYSEPGSSLEPSEIEGESYGFNMSVRYQMMRQRNENLEVAAGVRMRNTENEALGTELSKDRIRKLNLELNYDINTMQYGYNAFYAVLYQGLDVAGSTGEGDLNISRAEAEADFTKLELGASHQQLIEDDWLFVGNVMAQLASGPLFSSEEIGFGGQQYGRAYDPSEIVGDHGITASAELRYMALDPFADTTIQPFMFYDRGHVWNDDSTQEASESASSAGGGIYVKHESGLGGSLGLAAPLTRSVDFPQYGNGKNPRFFFNMSYSF